MTDRVKGVYVALDKDYRTDDVESILTALKMVKGVVDVSINITDFDDWNNRTRIRQELATKLWKVLKNTEEGA